MADHAAGWPQQAAPAKDRSRTRTSDDASDRETLLRSPRLDTTGEDADPGAELMERLKTGDSNALSALFDRYYRLVLTVASKILRDRGEAEDVSQEVFLELFRNAHRFDPLKGTAKSWIVTLAYHKSLNRRKYLALRGAFEDHEISDWDGAEKPGPFGSWSCGPGSTDASILSIVQQGLERLTSKQREVVQLACFEGYLLSEIAARMKESLGNVRHHYYRGINKLREFVKEKEKSEPARGGKAAFFGGGK